MKKNEQQQLVKESVTANDTANEWGTLLNDQIMKNIALQKQVTDQTETIEELTQKEADLVDHIQHLEEQLRAIPRPLSPEAAEIAAQGKAAIANEKEKAAP